MPETSIYVATHKQLNMKLPPEYRLCQVNAAVNGRWDGYVHDDDSDDNISAKNCYYSELTALYALWKNQEAGIKGLAHYRRFFSDVESPSIEDYTCNSYDTAHIGSHVMRAEQMSRFLESCDIILEHPDQPLYVDGYEDLHRWVFDDDIKILTGVIEENFPDYVESYRYVLSRTGISYLNMMIARSEIFDAYCEWLFDVLGKVEALVSACSYDPQHKRIFGYLSEVLLNVWVSKNALKVKYAGMSFLLEESGLAGKTRSLVRSMLPLKVRCERILDATDAQARYERVYGKMTGDESMTGEQSDGKLYGGHSAKNSADSITLIDIYSTFHNAEDIFTYYSQFKELNTIRENLIDNAEVITVFYEGYDLYPYPQSNRFCIVNIFPKDADEALKLIKESRKKYSERYTVNIRIITDNESAAEDIAAAADEAGRFFICSLYN